MTVRLRKRSRIMENEKEKVTEEQTQSPDLNGERLKVIAEKENKTVEEFLDYLEEKQTVVEQNESAKSRSTGSQNSKTDFSLDPTGTEFLKGLWGK